MIKYPIYYYLSGGSNKSCNKLPNILPPVRRIIAIGDIHGDIIYFLKSLKLAKVIDYDDNKLKNISKNDKFNWIKWTGNDTVLVQVGDQIDGCRLYPQTNDISNNCVDQLLPDILVFNLLDKLTEISKPNGKIISLLGNHEIMNVMGDFRYVSKNSISVFDPNNFDNAMKIRKKLFSKGNKYAEYLACHRKTAVIIGNNLFIHGGIIPKIADKYDITKLNNIISDWLLNKIEEDDIDNLLNHELESPFWNRLFSSLPSNSNIDNKTCQLFLKTMEFYNIGNLIIGHTPQFINNKMGINSTCNINDKSIWRIDIGGSYAFDVFNSENDSRNIQVLEIINDNQFNVLKL